MQAPRYSQRQELFDVVFLCSQNLGFRTFDRLPSSQTEYPFAILRHPTLNSASHGKFRMAGTLEMNIDVWGHQNDLGSHDLIMFQLEQELIKLKRLSTVYVDLMAVSPSVVKLTEGDEELLHGVIQVSYRMY